MISPARFCALSISSALSHTVEKSCQSVCVSSTVCLLLIFLFVDCYYNNSILWSKYPKKNLWRWPPSSSLPPHLQWQLPLPLCLFTTAEPTQQQRHRGYYGCYNVKVDRKVASPVVFFFVYALCVIYVQGFFSAVSSRSSRSKQAAATSQTGLAFHSTTPYYGDDGLLRFVFFALYQPS